MVGKSALSIRFKALGALAATERNDRHDPKGRRDYLSIQHVARYAFAAKILSPGMSILDVACGTGYGAEILAHRGCNVTAGDLDCRQLALSQRRSENVSFACMDVLNLPFPNDFFDAVVSFETIEHVTEGQRFLDEMHRVLKPDGLFICSTPNIAYTAHPPYHLKEYEPGEFYAIVSNRFKSTQKYGQYFRSFDRLADRFNWVSQKSNWQYLIYFPARVFLAIVRRLRLLSDLIHHNSEPAEYLETQIGRYYAVGPYSGSKLLRIMVTVSVK